MELSNRGLIWSTIFHGIILFLLIFFGFSYPDPPPEDQGILINFGTSDTGLGDVEPAGDEFQGEDQVEPVPLPIVTPTPSPKVAQATKPVDKVVQDFEEAPVKERKPSPEEIRQQELEKQRLEEVRKKREEEQRKLKQQQEIDNRAKSAFGNAGAGTTQGSEGITSGSGNQGSLGGTPGAPNYSDGGGLGGGNDYGLGNRKIRGTLPLPLLSACNVTQRIVVRVQINVDKDGNVSGTPTVIEATYQDDCIYRAVIEAAAKAKFSADAGAAFRQQGWIRYIIEP
jgi:colicin import membrane protein